MLNEIERRSRRRECLELEAQYGQFLPCERYADPEHLRRHGAPSSRPALANRFWAALITRLRALREAFLSS